MVHSHMMTSVFNGQASNLHKRYNSTSALRLVLLLSLKTCMTWMAGLPLIMIRRKWPLLQPLAGMHGKTKLINWSSIMAAIAVYITGSIKF